MGFFDDYPAFFETSRTGASPNRLNARHTALIESNLDVIDGRRILDIASHDARWSFAALRAGASHVTGVEAREQVVERGIAAMRAYAVADQSFDFLVGDAVEVMSTLRPASFDTVFCFGFLYHTLAQMELLLAIARLRPRHLLVDTAVVRSDEPLILLRAANTSDEGQAVRRSSDGPGEVIVGKPSLPAVELMLASAGFTFTRYDWAARHQGAWVGLEDYRAGNRVTLRAALST